ncbi:uncharacterized protein EV420DRAFT_1576193 [Desarmillaria tabescens]|uniref:Uncharacterized protein n=1 Tax=Armillaria tabescens TaxID=1929756 RepID=A0AA39JJN2_ARMTA|nr:uncharacterized protein EV420DRAFT_1576193 [Desarmillaria tabescens]KAK0443699.1 hypothetical protein EV420DRAFT_1576193 [Desarmillaria tabescens]
MCVTKLIPLHIVSFILHQCSTFSLLELYNFVSRLRQQSLSTLLPPDSVSQTSDLVAPLRRRNTREIGKGTLRSLRKKGADSWYMLPWVL